MLQHHVPAATIAVKDLKAAREFYEGKLGLDPGPSSHDDHVAMYECGGSTLMVYESRFAGTNQATCVTWIAGDEVEAIVDALAGKGVAFEQYDDMPGATRKGNVHHGDGMKAAWFRDPDGNIIAVVGD